MYTVLGVRTALHDLTGSEHKIVHAYKVSGWAARSHGFGTLNRTCLEGIRKGLQDLTGKEHQIATAYEISGPGGKVSRVRDTRSNTPKRYQDGAVGSYGFGPTDSRCLQGIRSGRQDLTGKTYQIEPAYTVSGRGCRISRVGNYRSYMPTRHQEDTSGSHGFETPDRTCLLGVSGRSCRISLVGNYRSYMPTRHQEGTSGSHGFETPDRTCLLGVTTVLYDLKCSEHKIVYAYNISGRSCRISWVGNYRSYMPTTHQEETSGSHWFETPDRTCLLGVRTALNDLTGSEHKIVHAYKVSGRSCKISRIRKTKSYMPRGIRKIEYAYNVSGRAAGSHGLGTTDLHAY